MIALTLRHFPTGWKHRRHTRVAAALLLLLREKLEHAIAVERGEILARGRSVSGDSHRFVEIDIRDRLLRQRAGDQRREAGPDAMVVPAHADQDARRAGLPNATLDLFFVKRDHSRPGRSRIATAHAPVTQGKSHDPIDLIGLSSGA